MNILFIDSNCHHQVFVTYDVFEIIKNAVNLSTVDSGHSWNMGQEELL